MRILSLFFILVFSTELSAVGVLGQAEFNSMVENADNLDLDDLTPPELESSYYNVCDAFERHLDPQFQDRIYSLKRIFNPPRRAEGQQNTPISKLDFYLLLKTLKPENLEFLGEYFLVAIEESFNGLYGCPLQKRLWCAYFGGLKNVKFDISEKIINYSAQQQDPRASIEKMIGVLGKKYYCTEWLDEIFLRPHHSLDTLLGVTEYLYQNEPSVFRILILPSTEHGTVYSGIDRNARLDEAIAELRKVSHHAKRVTLKGAGDWHSYYALNFLLLQRICLHDGVDLDQYVGELIRQVSRLHKGYFNSTDKTRLYYNFLKFGCPMDKIKDYVESYKKYEDQIIDIEERALKNCSYKRGSRAGNWLYLGWFFDHIAEHLGDDISPESFDKKLSDIVEQYNASSTDETAQRIFEHIRLTMSFEGEVVPHCWVGHQ